MRSTTIRLWVALWSLLAAVGCGEPIRGNPCTPGQTISCPCVGGGTGAQTCSPAGSYGACSCPNPGEDAGRWDPDVVLPTDDRPIATEDVVESPDQGRTNDVGLEVLASADVSADVSSVGDATTDATAPGVDVVAINDIGTLIDIVAPPMDLGAPTDLGIPSDSPMGGGMDAATVVSMIGPSGGTVSLNGVQLTIPAGALSTTTAIRITETDEAPPAGYRAFSPVYRFEPDGTTFTAPVTVTLPYRGDVRVATLFWSRPGGGWDRLGGVPTTTSVDGAVSHFSRGFVADGVDYSETPDRTSAYSRMLDTRYGTATGIPSAVALFFSVEDSRGRPVPGLNNSDFEATEDGTMVSSEGRPVVLPNPGLQVFVTLSIDVSSSTTPFLPTVIAAARGLVDQLEARRVPAQVAIELFAGDASPMAWQRHTLDLALVRLRLDAIGSYRPADPSSTNLYGAVVQGVSALESAELSFESRNAGGAYARGYLVVFTDGADTAGRATLNAARMSALRPRNQVVTVGLRGADFSVAARSALQQIGGRAFIEVVDRSVLDREFRWLASRVAGQTQATYVLGYCSPRRSGTHTVGVSVVGATPPAPEAGEVREGQFSAAGFGPGCSVMAFEPSVRCAGAQCGGLACGACDDRTSSCNQGSRRCVSNCLGRCGTASFVNQQGYTQTCEDRPESPSCRGRCSNGICTAATQICAGTQNSCVRMIDGTFRCWGRGFGSSVPAVSGVAQVSVGLLHGCALFDNGTVQCWGPRIPTGGHAGSLIPGLTNAVEISSGQSHSCARLSDRTVRCWGDDGMGQVGGGSIMGLGNVAQVSAGGTHTCVLMNDGSVRCWGSNSSGQTGGASATFPIPGLGGVRQISCGGAHTCALLDEGTVRCWGNNSSGQTGGGTTTTSIPDLRDVVEISAGGDHTCARLRDGTVRCWGASSDGQTGGGTTTEPVQGLVGVARVSAGGLHTCALLNSGAIRCWGRNSSGESGGSSSVSFLPGIVSAVHVNAGLSNSCALLADGTVRCWGSNFAGENGGGTLTRSVPGLSNVVQISTGGRHSCGLLGDGSVRCWGYNLFGQTGGGSAISSIPNLGGALQVSAGEAHSCARLSDGTVRCWGSNEAGQTGGGSVMSSILGLNGVEEISAGGQHTCARLNDGSVRCWGSNANGQTGGGSATTSIPGLSGVIQISAGSFHTCAVLVDRTVRCWGINSGGRLGGGSTTMSIPGLSNVVRVSAGGAHTCAVLADGSVRCWGDNSSGQTGAYQPILGFSDVVDIDSGGAHTCVRFRAGTIGCWGDNASGQTAGGALPVQAF